MFKCNQCDFKSSKRRSVTKHIGRMQESPSKDHDGASWTMVTDIEPSKTFKNLHEVKKAPFETDKLDSTEVHEDSVICVP